MKYHGYSFYLNSTLFELNLAKKMAAAAGVEPATCSLGESRSIQLSYATAFRISLETNPSHRQNIRRIGCAEARRRSKSKPHTEPGNRLVRKAEHLPFWLQTANVIGQPAIDRKTRNRP